MTVDGPLPGASDAVTRYFDASGNLTKAKNGLGHETLYGDYDARGLAGYSIDANGTRTNFTYDARGRLVQTQRLLDAGTQTNTIEYNRFGKPSKITSSSGTFVEYNYNNYGFLIQMRLPDTKGNNYPVNTTSEIEHIQYLYDTLGRSTGINIATEINKRVPQNNGGPRGGITWVDETTIDTHVTSSSTLDNLGNVHYNSGNNGQQVTYSYNKNLQVKTITDAQNRLTTFQYDSEGHLTREIRPDNKFVTYTYDNYGYVNSVTDARGKVTSYKNNAFGERIQAVSPDTGTANYNYDVAGRLTSVTRGDGTSITNTYDALGRRKTITTNGQNTTYTYDNCGHGIGRLCRVDDSSGYTSYSYNDAGQVTTLTNQVSNVTFTRTASYDAHGRITQVNYPNNYKVRYGYDAADRINSIEAYVGGVWKQVINSVDYLPFGAATGYGYGNGIWVNRTVDNDGRINRITAGSIQDLSYAYNNVDDITKITNAKNTSVTQNYGYDNLSRLKNQTSSYRNESYNYDANSNRSSHVLSGVTTSYSTSGSNNKLLSANKSGLNRSFSYDGRGNIKTLTAADGQLCACLSLSRSNFYYQKKSKQISPELVRLKASIQHIHATMDATYGSRRMVLELQEQGFSVGRYKVRQLMKSLHLVAKRPKQHRYPKGGAPSVIAPNLLNRQFTPEQVNSIWAGDITYIRTSQGWLYLSVIMDLFSRKVVSWAFSDKPNSELTIRALRLAMNKRKPSSRVMFHSDQGAQYTSENFQRCLRDYRVIGSMSRRGNCLDNAVTERFFRSLKSERVNYRRYENRRQAIADIINYIEPFYNQVRRHSRLGNISPVQFEEKMMKCA